MIFQQRLLEIFLDTTIFLERENDEKQIQNANELYNKMLEYANKTPHILFFNFKDIGVDLNLIFTDKQYDFYAAFIKKLNLIIVNVQPYCMTEFKNKDYNAIFLKMKEAIIHEIIHYLDSLRIDMEELPKGDYVTPEEFNAYFLSISSELYDILNDIKSKNPNNLNKFYEQFGNTVNEFLKLMWKLIELKNSDMKKEIDNDKKYKYKWNKRLYQLYFELKDNFLKNVK